MSTGGISSRTEVGNVLPIFANSAHLHDQVEDVTKKLNLEPARAAVALGNQQQQLVPKAVPEPVDYEFSDTLKFSVKPDLSASFEPFKNFKAGLPEGKYMIDLIGEPDSMPPAKQYRYGNDYNPFNHFQYPEIVKQFLKEKPVMSSTPTSIK